MPAPSGFRSLAVLVCLALVAGGAYYAYTLRASRVSAIPEYTTTTVSKGDIVQLVTATGQLDAVLSVDVGSQISGQILKLYVDFNSIVKAGQKLAELDPSTYQQALLQAQANLASAEASYALAELNAKRSDELFAKSLVTQQDNDQTQVQLKQAKGQLLINQAMVENARVNLSRCTIFSPIDGIVISKQTEVGKTVASSLNVPTLFTIDNDLAEMQITAAVGEGDVGSIHEGQKTTFGVDAFPTRTFNGQITQVRNAPKNTNNVITYDTIIGVENRDLKLRPGMTANVSIIVARRDGVIRVPNATLRVRIPEGLTVTGGNEATPGTKSGEVSSSSGSNREGGGGRRGGMLGPDATPEQKQKMRDIMAEIGFVPGSGPPSPEQREQMRKLMVERGLITAEQAAGRNGSNGEPAYVTRTVYRLPGGNKTANPEAVRVKVGITDTYMSEISEGLAEGDVLLTGVTLPGAKPSAAPSNPFGGQPRRF